VTLILDLLNSKYVHWLLMLWPSILPNLGFLGLSIPELRYGTRQTDGQTDTAAHFIMPFSLRGRGIKSNAILTFVNFAVTAPILISKQQIPSPPPLSTLNLTTVTHYSLLQTYLILS